MSKNIYLSTRDKSLEELSLSLPPNNEIIVDDMGDPSVMVKIPQLTYKDVGIGTSTNVLPAFKVNGKTIPYLYISKYQNIVKNDRAYSLPYKAPAVNMTIDQARTYCENKGDGWHLMTNAEWAAIALWCKKHNCQPYGNNNGSYADYYNTTDKGAPMPIYDDNYSGNVPYTATGSGPKNWFHNDDFSGIADLNGNVCEWVGGLRLNNGEIQVIPDNNAAQAVDQGANSALWKAISQTGAMVAPGTDGALKFNSTTGIKTTSGTFKGMTVADGITIPDYLKALALYPNDAADTYKGDYFYTSTSGEKVPYRGGRFYDEDSAGVFCCYLFDGRSNYNYLIGFRSAFVPGNLLTD